VIDAKDNIHTVSFREAAGLWYIHKEALRARKGNAFLGMNLPMNDEFYGRVGSEWEASISEAGRP
jgi:hypothetical protein